MNSATNIWRVDHTFQILGDIFLLIVISTYRPHITCRRSERLRIATGNFVVHLESAVVVEIVDLSLQPFNFGAYHVLTAAVYYFCLFSGKLIF